MKRLLALIFLFPSLAFADGVLYTSPQRGEYSTGEVFVVRVLADTGGQSINAAEAELDFNPQALEVESVSTSGSILNSWSTEPKYSNALGTIEFSGWADKKYSGHNGLLITITFKALRSMSGNARFAAGAILAADNQESNIISTMRSASFTIKAAPASAPAPQPKKNDTQVEQEVPQRVGGETGIIKPDPPSLAEYPRTAQIGERIYLKGTSDPDTPMKVFLQYGDNSPETQTIMSAADGTFTYASDEISKAGVYYLWVIEERGSTESDPSRMAKIEVQNSGLSASAQEAAALVEESIPFLLIIAFVGLSIAYFMHKRSTQHLRSDFTSTGSI